MGNVIGSTDDVIIDFDQAAGDPAGRFSVRKRGVELLGINNDGTGTGLLNGGSVSAVLLWDGSDYTPTSLKASSNPKEFRGPVDPSSVTGVSLNQYDVWVRA